MNFYHDQARVLKKGFMNLDNYDLETERTDVSHASMTMSSQDLDILNSKKVVNGDMLFDSKATRTMDQTRGRGENLDTMDSIEDSGIDLFASYLNTDRRSQTSLTKSAIGLEETQKTLSVEMGKGELN